MRNSYFEGEFTPQHPHGGDVDPAAVLPPEALFAAISGHLDSAAPLVGWARELGDRHAALIPNPALKPHDADSTAVHADIARIVAAIDSWAEFYVQRNPHVCKHIHSLGEVLSVVARTYVHAWWTISHPTDEQIQQEAWFRLGEVQEGYTQFVADIDLLNTPIPLGRNAVCHRTPTR